MYAEKYQLKSEVAFTRFEFISEGREVRFES